MNFKIIKREIDQWDPIDLLNHAPPDEYVDQNGMMIYEVFSKAFGTTFTKSIDECVCIAKKMMEQESQP